MERLCLTCQSPIQGRADKKFCDDICRSNFHYLRKATDQKIVKQINQILKNNRKILKEKTLKNNGKMSRELLANLGYDFNYFTHFNIDENGQKKFFCYEYGYIELDYKQVQVIEKEVHKVMSIA